MLGRELIPNNVWEHFPLIENTEVSGILVDGYVSKKGTDEVFLNSIDYIYDTNEFTININNGLQNLVFTEPSVLFGEYRLVQHHDTNSGILIQLIFFVPSLPSSDTSYNLGGIEFAVGAVNYLDKKVFSLNTGSGVISLIGQNGIALTPTDAGIILSVDNEIPCPQDCPQVDLKVRTINGTFLNKRHVHIEGATHTVLPNYDESSLQLINNLTPCCDCEDQAPIWNAFVSELERYKMLINELEDIEELYNKLRTLLGNVTEDSCDIWKKIRDLHFPEGLFCRIVS